MKEFWVYTLLRLGLFVGSAGIVFGVWWLITEDVPLIWVIVIAFAVSGAASYFLLERQREQFAARVEGRAARVSRKFEEQRSREDAD